MHDMEIMNESELDEQAFKGAKYNDRKPSGDDPISDWLLKQYH